MTRLGDLLRRGAARFGDRPAIGDLTYAALARAAATEAPAHGGGIEAVRAAPGERFVVELFGVWERGGVVLLAPPDASIDVPAAEPGPECALLVRTSGSTGGPRLVEHTHGSILGDLEAVLAVRRGGPGDTLLCALPPWHLFGLVVGILAPLACGARVVFPTSLLPSRLAATVRDEHVTHAVAVPALLDAMRDQVEIGASLRAVFVGGAAVDPAWRDVLAARGIALDVGYGLTEAGPVVSVGAPLPGVDVRFGADDEILVKGPGLMRGYFGDPAATARAFDDGWLRTGDRGRLDEAGRLVVTGRLKETIVKANGDTLSPEEIEAAYRGGPGLAETCVAGVPDVHGNDEPVLFAVPAGTRAAAEAAYAARHAAAPDRLRVARVVWRDEPLPRTATGKVRRLALAREQRLRDLLAEETGRGDAGLDDDLPRTLGLDSLALLRLLALVEQRFAIRFDDHRLAELRTLRRILESLS